MNSSAPRVAAVSARFYPDLSDRLLSGCRSALRAAGCEPPDEYAVPGVFELPLAVQTAVQTGRYDGIVALGVVIRGETAHFDYVCRGVTDGLRELSLRAGFPIGFGVLTTENREQALARAALPGEPGDNKGEEAARVVLDMLSELERIRKGGVGP